MNNAPIPSYAAVFRTHLWDPEIERMAARAKACCRSGEFVVAADETRGPLLVEPFAKLSHTDDFADFGLPNLPDGQVLWWNADYILYLARRAFERHDYYVLSEYDVFLSCDIDAIVKQCGQGGIDLVVRDLKPLADNHWCRPTIASLSRDPWWALLPFMIVSRRAVDLLLETRRSLAGRLGGDGPDEWPYCETFIPTVVGSTAGMRTADIGNFVDAKLLRWRPVLSVRDPQLTEPGILAHPVMGGRRFIRAFIANEPAGSHVMTDGRLRPELRREDPLELRAAINGDFTPESAFDSAAYGRATVSRATNRPGPCADLSLNKPATQSSISNWSRGRTTQDDAKRAVNGILPVDFAFHTNGEADPWWRVDLLEECSIDSVEIVNRPDLPYRFRHFKIDFSSDDLHWTTVFSKTDGSLVSGYAPEPAVFPMPEAVPARYVRIVQLGDNPMHLRRIRVLGHPSSGAASGGADAFAHLFDAWVNRPGFAEAVKRIVDREMLGRDRESHDVDSLAVLSAGMDCSLYASARMARAKRFTNAAGLRDFACREIPRTGMIVMVGVESTQSASRLAEQVPHRKVSVFSPSDDLPPRHDPPRNPAAPGGAKLPEFPPNVELIGGKPAAALAAFLSERAAEPVALVHVGKLPYFETRRMFEALAGAVRAGTVLVFDEYFNFPGWRLHEYKAFQEFAGRHGTRYEYIGLVPRDRQVALRVLGWSAGAS